MNTEMFLRGWKYFLLLFRTGKTGIGCYIFFLKIGTFAGRMNLFAHCTPDSRCVNNFRFTTVFRFTTLKNCCFDNMEYTHVTSFFFFWKCLRMGAIQINYSFMKRGEKGKKIWKIVVPSPLLPFVIVSVVDTWYKRINMLYCSHYTSFCYQMAMIQSLTYPDLSPRWWDVTDYSLSLPFATLSPRQKPIRFLLEYTFL